MYSNHLRLTGLSGIDTDMIVRQLMKAESIRYDNMFRRNVALQWRQDAYRGIGATMKNFQNAFLNVTDIQNSFRSAANFTNNSVAVRTVLDGREINTIRARATGTAASGTHTLEVTHVAQSHTFHSADVFGLSATGKYGHLRPPLNTDGEVYTFTLNGLTRTVSLSESEIAAINTAAAQNYDDLTAPAVIKQKVDDAINAYIAVEWEAYEEWYYNEYPGTTFAESNPAFWAQINHAEIAVISADATAAAQKDAETARTEPLAEMLQRKINLAFYGSETAAQGIGPNQSKISVIADGDNIRFEALAGHTFSVSSESAERLGFSGRILSTELAATEKIGELTAGQRLSFTYNGRAVTVDLTEQMVAEMTRLPEASRVTTEFEKALNAAIKTAQSNAANRRRFNKGIV
jgi:flagellar capping protein FliD